MKDRPKIYRLIEWLRVFAVCEVKAPSLLPSFHPSIPPHLDLDQKLGNSKSPEENKFFR